MDLHTADVPLNTPITPFLITACPSRSFARVGEGPEVEVVLQLPIPIRETVGLIDQEKDDRKPERGFLEENELCGHPTQTGVHLTPSRRRSPQGRTSPKA